MDPYIKITKKFTKKFVSKVINRQYFHRKTGLRAYCPNIYTVYTGYPRRVLNDDSKSLGDLGLLPTGILHLVRTLAHNTNTSLLLL